MRILELNFERGWRGGERQTLWTSQYFRDAGHAVELLARAEQAMGERYLKLFDTLLHDSRR